MNNSSLEELASKLKDEGNKLFKSGNYRGAHAKYSEALEHCPSNSVIYSNRSLASIKLKNYQSALFDSVECIKHNPGWYKGFMRKAMAHEGLGQHNEVKQSAIEGFRLSGDRQVKNELVSLWLKANKILNSLPEGSIELPRGITIMSQDYLHVLVCLMQSLSGECPLSLTLMEQCLYSCANQIESLLVAFDGLSCPIVKEWSEHLPHEVYPHNSANPEAKVKLLQDMKLRSEKLTTFLNDDVDPSLFPLLRPIFGLVVLIVLNRTNILTECNTGHHAAELMNQALIPLFEMSILSTEEYYSMYIGRICALLDSFIGRGYKPDATELTKVNYYCNKLKKAIKNYPKDLQEYHKDVELAERTLSNVEKNILLPPTLSPPKIPITSSMSVEMANQTVKEKPQEAMAYVTKHLQELESVKFLTMGEVEELLTMTGIFHELGEEDNALKVFRKGEQAFFQVLGHMLSSNTLTLDQCPATLVPMRQLALNEALLLKDQEFADVILRWKCLFKDMRKHLIYCSSGNIFKAFFQWYTDQEAFPKLVSEEDTQTALLKQIEEEEILLKTFAKTVLANMAGNTYGLIQNHIPDGAITIDYIFFAPLKERPLLEAYCVIFTKYITNPIVCELDYKAIHDHAASVKKLANKNAVTPEKINEELALLAKEIFPPSLLHLLSTSQNIHHLYISPDSDIVDIPFDMLPVSLNSTPAVPLLDLFSVSILPSMRNLFLYNENRDKGNQLCCIVGNPNFNLCNSTVGQSAIDKIVTFFSEYFNITSSTGPILEQLLHSQEEVDFVSLKLKSLGFKVQDFTGDQAVLSNVISVENLTLLHISSHAYSGTRMCSAFRGNFFYDLKSSAIALAGFNTLSREQFDLLPSNCGITRLPPLAIFSMKLQGTKLVYLSTCDSATGTTQMQEAVDNLAEAFLTAGAETVIATLQPVSDQLATKFSKIFYEKLISQNIRPSEALAHAKKYFKNETSHKLFDYAYVCYGLDKPFLAGWKN